MEPLGMTRSDFGISAIFASTSLSPAAPFSSLARSLIAARSSSVNPLDLAFFAGFLSALAKLRASNESQPLDLRGW
jgi:hypothetical protein